MSESSHGESVRASYMGGSGQSLNITLCMINLIRKLENSNVNFSFDEVFSIICAYKNLNIFVINYA